MFREDSNIVALGPEFQSNSALGGFHQLGTGSSCACHQIGMRGHSMGQAVHRTIPGTSVFAGRSEFRHRAGHSCHSRRKVRGRAAVDPETGAIQPCEFFEGGLHGLLHRVVDLDIFRATTRL